MLPKAWRCTCPKLQMCNDPYMMVLLFLQLAPSLPLQEDFVYHWKAITHYYIETSGKKLPKYCVKLRFHTLRECNL